jgi:hypothetical protein
LRLRNFTQRGIACDNGLFVALGASGAIVTSESGDSWIRRNSGARDFPHLLGCAGNQARYVVIDHKKVNSYKSFIFIRSAAMTSFRITVLSCVTLILLSVARADPPLPLQWSLGPQFTQFALSGDQLTLGWTTIPGRLYLLEGTEDFAPATWIPLTTNIPASGSSLSMSSSISNSPQLFHRVAEESQ